MVRVPDFVYGIVPARAEYGFEKQPTNVDNAVVIRVLSLASSFQWTGTTATDVVAIAMDRGTPNLVVKYTTDPRDPDGRTSLCMSVWVEKDTEVADRLVHDLWPTSFLPVSVDQFSAATGRVIAGPTDTFVARDFDSAWGKSTTKLQRSQSIRRTEAVRSVTQDASRGSNISSTVWKWLAAFTSLGCLVLAPYSRYLYLEKESFNKEVTDANKEVTNANKEVTNANKEVTNANNAKSASESKVKEIKNQLENESAKHFKAISVLNESESGLKDSISSLLKENRELRNVIAGDDTKIDKAELRGYKQQLADVQTKLKALDHAFGPLKDAIQKKPGWWSELKEGGRQIISPKNDASKE